MVPFLNLRAQYDVLKDEMHHAIGEVLESSAFAGGPFVAKFEQAFAEFSGARYAIGVGNGTDALWFALLALGVGSGDEVITVPNTFIATAEAISFCGARPVFVDVDPQTYTMNPALLEQAITPRTKAIIPVHLFGQMADMDPILEIARKHKLFVVEDACQAHGATYKSKKAGSMGDAGCFSFYPGKNLGAYGEAGGVTTNNEAVKRAIEMLRDHGQAKKYIHKVVGWNGRMDGIQGAVLSVKLKHLAQANSARQSHARLYDQLFRDTKELVTPRVAAYGTSVFHLYVIRVGERDALLRALAEKGINCGIHYPIPLHLQEAYSSLGLPKGSFPVAEKCAEEFLSLPMFPELTVAQITEVAAEVQNFLSRQSRPEKVSVS